MLKAEGICKSYRRQKVLNGVSFSAGSGQTVGIIGANGCGKTTLLSVLAGTVRPDAGSVLLDGREAVGHPKVFAAAAAYVPQESPFMEELTAWDNLCLWYRGDTGALRADLKNGYLSGFGIDGILKKRVGRLSGGMKKRLSIACALANHAGLLILDEPGAALDLECKAFLRAFLREFAAAGKTAVLTSHEPDEIAVCTVLYVLKNGGLTQIPTGLSAGELAELLHAERGGTV